MGTSAVVTSIMASETVVHNSATRASRPSAAPRPNIQVGAGGKGGPMRPREAPQGGETLSEQVGQIIDESQNNEGAQQEVTDDPVEKASRREEGEQAESQPNPKKRMWEEDKEAAKQAQRAKDEL